MPRNVLLLLLSRLLLVVIFLTILMLLFLVIFWLYIDLFNSLLFIVLVVAINYLRDANSLLILHLLSKQLNNCSLLSSFGHSSSVSDPKISDTKVLLLITSINVSNSVKCLGVPLLSSSTLCCRLSLMSSSLRP
jgi:hypothetical protein